MQINRHNYETFFLLYVDKELSGADRKAVELFVKENPDLQIELQALQQTVVTSEDIVLDKKDWLYMEEGISALQENLLLYADDELTGAERKSVEVQLQNDKVARAEWDILKQTKLQPDAAVVFADKQSLYRTEGARVVAFKWWRVAAAAVLLGFVIWGGVALFKNNSIAPVKDEGELVKGTKTESTKSQNENPVNSVTAINQPEIKTAPETIVTTTAQKNIPDQKAGLNKQAVEINNKQNKTEPKESVAVKSNDNNKPNNNLPKPYFENINNKASNETVATTVIPEINNSSKVSGSNTAIVRTNPKENGINSIVTEINKNSAEQTTTAAMLVNNKTTDEKNNARYLNVDDDKEKRTGLGGFLRKAKRMIERTTNINTGDGIKVAGFEIALK